MRRFRAIAASLALVAAGSEPAAAQTVDEQLKQEQLVAAQLANEKARLGFFDPLRAVAPPDAKLVTTEKAAEAAMLRYELYQGLAAKVVDGAFGSSNRGGKFAPLLVMGGVPPTTAHYDAFVERRDTLLLAIASAQKKWNDAKPAPGGKVQAQIVAGAAITAFTTLYSLFKTDVSIAGASLAAPPGGFEGQLLRVLKARFPAVDMSRFGVANGKGDADFLLGSVKGARDLLWTSYRDEYLPILTHAPGGKPENIKDEQIAAAGTLMKAVLDSYDALEKDLYTVAGDTLAASVIRREGLLKDRDRTNSPVLFVTGQ